MELEKILNDIEDSIIKAEVSFQMWWAIEHDGRKDHIRIMNQHDFVDFFTAAIPIFLQGILINLSSIFDRAEDLSGIRSLKLELSKRGLNEALSEIEITLKPHEGAIKSIKGIRDQSVGHKKRIKTTSEIYQENPLTPDQIKELIADVKHILKFSGVSVDKHCFILQSERYKESTLNVIRALKKPT